MQQFATEEDVHVTKNATGQDIFVFDPFNETNTEITREIVESILKTYGIYAPKSNLNL
jgi:hypothetical protein